MVLSKALLDVVVCPVSKSKLMLSECEHELVSLDAGIAYPIQDNIPVLLEDKARRLSSSEIAYYKVLVSAEQKTAG